VRRFGIFEEHIKNVKNYYSCRHSQENTGGCSSLKKKNKNGNGNE
jgi:hypothetical protein